MAHACMLVAVDGDPDNFDAERIEAEVERVFAPFKRMNFNDGRWEHWCVEGRYDPPFSGQYATQRKDVTAEGFPAFFGFVCEGQWVERTMNGYDKTDGWLEAFFDRFVRDLPGDTWMVAVDVKS